MRQAPGASSSRVSLNEHYCLITAAAAAQHHGQDSARAAKEPGADERDIKHQVIRAAQGKKEVCWTEKGGREGGVWTGEGHTTCFLGFFLNSSRHVCEGAAGG